MQNRRNERERLERAIERLYETFAHYALRPHVEGCDHCVFPEDNKKIHSKPLRDLTPTDLSKYAHKAMTTWGEEEDFKHFLPRLFELLVLGDDWLVSVESLIGKLDYAAWREWPKLEQEAIEEYLMALWQFALVSVNNYGRIDDYLWGIARAMNDLGPFLDAWREKCHESVPALRHMADFIEFNIYFDRKLPFAPGVPDHSNENDWLSTEREIELVEIQRRQVVNWLLDQRTLAVMEEGFFKYSTQPFAEELSKAVNQLGWLSDK